MGRGEKAIEHIIAKKTKAFNDKKEKQEKVYFMVVFYTS
jgi:hypothetical protein